MRFNVDDAYGQTKIDLANLNNFDLNQISLNGGRYGNA